MQLFTLGITWLSKWIISARTRIFYILIDERSEAAVNVACLPAWWPNAHPPLFLMSRSSHSRERNFLQFSQERSGLFTDKGLKISAVFFVIFINYPKSFWIWKIYISKFQIKMISNYFCSNWYSMVICHVCSGFIFKCIPYYSEVKEEIRNGHRCQKIPQCVPYITWFLMRTLGKSIWQSQFVPWMRTDTDL